MTPSDVLSICTQNGFVLVPDGTKLFLDGDLTKMTDDLAASIRANKAGLVELLRHGEANDQATTPAAPIPTTVPDDTRQPPPQADQADPDLDDFEERAAICEYDGGIPRDWAEGLARLCTMPRPDDIDPRRWAAIVHAAGVFADAWASQAHSLGWTVEQVFGVHQDNPTMRFDTAGLLMALADPSKTLVEMRPDAAVFEVGRFKARQTLQKDMIFSNEQRFLWD